MNPTESSLRAIKDRIAAVMGQLEDAAPTMGRKASQERMRNAADELHRCANEIQNLLMHIRPRS
jgi:hypothetical protein